MKEASQRDIKDAIEWFKETFENVKPFKLSFIESGMINPENLPWLDASYPETEGEDRAEDHRIQQQFKNNQVSPVVIFKTDQFEVLADGYGRASYAYHNNLNVPYAKYKVMFDKDLKEMSGMGAGCISGTPAKKKNKQDLFEYMIDRHKFIEELALRESINKIIDKSFSQALIKAKISSYINEAAKSKIPDSQHASTGINVLEELLKKIVPALEVDYKSLTTKKEQRDSYKAHILNAIQKTLTGADVNQQAGTEANAKVPAQPAPLAEEITMNVDPSGEVPEMDPSSSPDGDKFIDIDGKPSKGEEAEEDTFTIPGQDETGRNMAQLSYDKIEKNILDSYSLLSDEEDKKLFYDYLLANVRLYFDKFESEMQTDVAEPEAGSDIEATEEI